jgi:hypothetical protein
VPASLSFGRGEIPKIWATLETSEKTYRKNGPKIERIPSWMRYLDNLSGVTRATQKSCNGTAALVCGLLLYGSAAE